MKLLFDHNLSERLVWRLRDLFKESRHVAELELAHASDFEIWAHAKAHDFVIVTKDSDFNDIAVIQGFPPKVIWMRVGNCTTAQIEQHLRSNHAVITAFALNHNSGILVLF